MKKDNLNPELMVGDEVTVLYVDKSHGTMNTTKRFKDYRLLYRRDYLRAGPLVLVAHNYRFYI